MRPHPAHTVSRQLLNALVLFRGEAGDLPAATFQIFMMVALDPGTTVKEIVRASDITQSAASRHAGILGDGVDYRGKQGLGLIVGVESLEDRRNKQLFLTAKGRQLLLRILSIIDPSHQPDPDAYPTYSEWQRTGLVGGAR